MANPFRQGEHVNSGLQTFGCKIVPQVVMGGEASLFCQFAGAVKAPLTFGNFADAVGRFLLLVQFFKQFF